MLKPCPNKASGKRHIVLIRDIAALSGVMFVWISNAMAAEPWIGRWGAPNCGSGATRIVFTKSTLDLSSFDMMCKIRDARKKGNNHVFDLACPGENSMFNVSLSVQVNGDRLEFVEQQPGFEFDPKRYRRCKG